MDIRKLKEGTLVEITLCDVHTDDGGWTSKEQALKDAGCILKSQGTFLGVTKNNYVLLGSLISEFGGVGVRSYIPVGCIISVRKLK